MTERKKAPKLFDLVTIDGWRKAVVLDAWEDDGRPVRNVHCEAMHLARYEPFQAGSPAAPMRQELRFAYDPFSDDFLET